MVEEGLVYIKFLYKEAFIAKKDILESQIFLLKIAKIIRSYNIYRTKEIELKISLYKKMKELNSSISKLHKILPKAKIPEILHRIPQEERYSKPRKEKVYDRTIEEQIEEIEKRLNEIQSGEM